MTNKTYAELLAQGGGGASSGGWSRAIFTTSTITFTEGGTVVLSMVGAGGGGARATTAGSATGGNSAPWGRKKIKVSAADSLEITVGAGGAKGPAASTNGSAGGTSTVKLNGVTIMSISGGEGGVQVTGTATATAPTPTAAVTGADYWALGSQAGSAQATSGASATGGAAVNVFFDGKGRSPSISGTAAIGIGGSIGTDSGGVPLPWIVLAEFGFVVTDGAQATASTGVPGRGGESSTIMPGALAGAAANGTTRLPGYGAGGGASATTAQNTNGGDAYAYVNFTPAE